MNAAGTIVAASIGWLNVTVIGVLIDMPVAPLDGSVEITVGEGSNRSAETWIPEPPVPPATRTLLSGNRVAVWVARAVDIETVADQVSVDGSYNSAEST